MTTIGANHRKMDFTFAQRLELIMKERNLCPSQIAKLTGLRRQRIHEYVSGTSHPNDYAIKKIAIGLNVSADFLLGIEKLSVKADK